MNERKEHIETTANAPPPTRLQGPGPSGITGRAVSSRVEGRQRDKVRRVAGQVGEMHAGVRDKNHFHLLSLVLLFSLPVVNLRNRKRQVGNDGPRLQLVLTTSSVISLHKKIS